MDNNKKPSRQTSFSESRARDLITTAEDYTELIADLIIEKGEARIGEIAQILDISHVTALKTIQRLIRDGYVKKDHRKPVLLTKKGEQLATYCKERHNIVLDLLLKIGVPLVNAEIDAEGIEHHVSDSTLKVFKKFIRKN
ncbi:UNVERIFIED_CONTAM: hypothetical protein GTU68_042612 [Idotea baltica]|nr:hypothetical protein [Idotea baltica]